MGDFIIKKVNDDNLYLMHYGVPGMKWGRRKSPTAYGGSITKTGKYRASNGVVIGRSRSKGVAAIRRFYTSLAGRGLSSLGNMGVKNKEQRAKNRVRMAKERAALKEYYKVGGDKMLKRAANENASVDNKQNTRSTKKPKSNNKVLNNWADLGAAGGLVGVSLKKKGYGSK